MKKLKRIVEFIRENIDEEILNEMQIFNTRNTVGDETKLIYDKEKIQIYIYGNEYVEVIGLSDVEFQAFIGLLFKTEE